MKFISNPIRKKERGNVLFLILIAVALFAALSYAVTQSTRSGGGDNETSLISSAQLTQYPASVRTSVMRMILRGVDVQDLDFNEPANFGNCFVNNDGEEAFCVFHPRGGNATHMAAPAEFMDPNAGNTAGDWVYNTENEVYYVGTSGSVAGTPEVLTVETIAFLRGITEKLCDTVNQELGLPRGTGNWEVEAAVEYTPMIWANNTTRFGICDTSCGDTIGQDAAGAALNGQPFGCYVDNATPTEFIYYHVLVER